MMHIEIVTPEGKCFEGVVTSATFPGVDGSFQILSHHAPLVSALSKGTLKYVLEDASERTLEIDGGVVQVANNKTNVLIEKLLVQS